MKTHIFISYTSRDTCVSDEVLIKARTIFFQYSSVFVDRFSGKTKWHPQLVILYNIVRSHLFVVIESRSVYRSPWVILELLIAKLTLTPIIRVPIELLILREKANPTTNKVMNWI